MRNRNYALLWWGQLVSEVGNRFHWVAVSLWVYSVTGSAGSVSLAVASMFVGSLLVGPWAGVLVDRWDRRKILVASDLVRGVLVALIPPLMSINVWLVYADLILISVATA
ncbi:MAG: MFS transporter, partial [Armatimonadota bacterium]|nr:MFS transporter [Armatimonadota bacterium]MDR7506101.1 MFS transporter [Armatimonadota bacterium]MDR7510067.1 MFS transporter [Armatimonadota bacterium]